MKNHKNKILVVAAHPDDEVLGVGGTILKHVSLGDEVSIMIMGDGETARGDLADVSKRKNQLKEVSKILGAKSVIINNYPDNEFDTISLLQITKKVEKIINSEKPNVIYTHFSNDLNIDHQITFQAVLTACRPQPGNYVKEIYSFETLSSTEWQKHSSGNIFCPTLFVNIEESIDKKLNIIKKYKDELRDWPHSRSIEGINVLAKYRGAQSGCEFAEAFEVVRIIK